MTREQVYRRWAAMSESVSPSETGWLTFHAVAEISPAAAMETVTAPVSAVWAIEAPCR